MKFYAGDSVYVDFDEGWQQIVITTENGLATDPSNRIYLEREVWLSLRDYVARNTTWERAAECPPEKGEQHDIQTPIEPGED